MEDFKCYVCDRFFSSKKSLYVHNRKFQDGDEQTLSGKVICVLCDASLKTMKQLHEHITQKHEDIVLRFESKTFYCVKDFSDWKEDVERTTASHFVKHRGDERFDGYSVSRYYCHRSGCKKVVKERHRREKLLGSNKICKACPANIVVKLEENCEAVQISVEYQSVHIGHKMDIGRVPLSQSEKFQIAGELKQGVPKPVVLSHIRENFSPTKRLSYTHQKDLNNICRDFDIDEKVVLDKNDAMSVDLKVTKMQEEENNPVMLYKPYDEECSDHAFLEKSDFLLGIMNNAQRKLFELYGINGVMVDSTHGMNQYGFQLTTIMVNDSNHEGFPIAIMYSTKLTTEVYALFFKKIQEQFPDLKPRLLMSDDAPAIYNAWFSIFGNTRHLLCSWHVLRAWNKNIISKIKCDMRRAEVRCTLRNVLQETDTVTFERLSETTVKNLLKCDETKEFGEYFLTYYMHRVEQWAYCHRIKCTMNTNMKVERWHRELKYEEAGGRVIKRLDRSLSLVLTAITKKLIGRVVSLERGKLTSRIAGIRKRHDKSKELDAGSVLEMELGKSWKVPSSKASDMYLEMYDVCFEENCNNCTFKCSECGICIHEFTCTCLDYSVHYTICKHIHLVCQNLFLNRESPLNNDSHDLIIDINETDIQNHEETVAVSKEIEKIKPALEIVKEKAALTAEIQGLVTLVSKSSTLDQLKIIRNGISSLMSKWNSKSDQENTPILKTPLSMPKVIKKTPFNKKTTKQQRYQTRIVL